MTDLRTLLDRLADRILGAAGRGAMIVADDDAMLPVRRPRIARPID